MHSKIFFLESILFLLTARKISYLLS